MLNCEDDPFVSLDDINEKSVQTLGVDLAFLKERFGDQVDPNITLMNTSILTLNSALCMGNLPTKKFLQK